MGVLAETAPGRAERRADCIRIQLSLTLHERVNALQPGLNGGRLNGQRREREGHCNLVARASEKEIFSYISVTFLCCSTSTLNSRSIGFTHKIMRIE